MKFTLDCTAAETEALLDAGERLGRVILSWGRGRIVHSNDDRGTAAPDEGEAGNLSAASEAASEAIDAWHPHRGSPRPARTEPRDTRESAFPTAADRGQHDTMKRWAYLALWRWLHPDEPVIPSVFGTGPEPYPVPLAPILPLQLDLAEACRRLGFARLFAAAAGGAHDLLRAQECLVIQGFYAATTKAIGIEVAAVCARRRATRAPSAGPPPKGGFSWDIGAADAARAAYDATDAADRAEVAPLFSVGDWDRRDLDDCPPLTPLSLLPTTPSFGVFDAS
ncbi:MAG: hypothetical protein EXR31_10460 [Betaproteobacteria bacterium]|nr:hypothetical protein [Betaproteobacteria bacterium]